MDFVTAIAILFFIAVAVVFSSLGLGGGVLMFQYSITYLNGISKNRL